MYQLANAIYPLIDEVEGLEKILNDYKVDFEEKSLEMMRSKLGLEQKEEEDSRLILQLEENLEL